MGELIGFFIVLSIVLLSANKTIDSKRVHKWFNEDKDK